jgi:hypothetical protein
MNPNQVGMMIALAENHYDESTRVTDQWPFFYIHLLNSIYHDSEFLEQAL